MKLKFLSTVVGLAMSVMAAQAVITEVTFTGSTKGAFNANPLATTDTLLGLTYNGTVFNGTTTNGVLALGGLAPNNLGFFNLLPPAGGIDAYSGSTFTLQVLFTAPPGVSGNSLYTANLTGFVAPIPTGGGVKIDFLDNSPRVFDFNGTPPETQFTMEVFDLTVFPGQVSPINAFITVIPEMSTALPLALILGLAGFVEFRRRRIAMPVA
jgi:hypothetical protein